LRSYPCDAFAELAAAAIEAGGGDVDVAAMRAWAEYLGEHPEPSLDRVE
jgi:hypothetical protein